ncbi:MAG: hypothetical protein E7311_01565 [Clostridiales bacterium]|nr:hypothetical protein [Clostridiales bacterium]
MEEKNEKKKISTKKIMIITLLILVIIVCAAFTSYYFITEHNCNENDNEYTGNYQGEYSKIRYSANEEFRDLKLNNMLNSDDNYIILNDYNAYNELLKHVKNMSYILSENNDYTIPKDFFENNNLLAVECAYYGAPNMYSELNDVLISNNTATIKINRDRMGVTADYLGDIYFIPIPQNITTVNVEFKNVTHYNRPIIIPVADKPIIYLYPSETTNVTVELGKPENITCSYPKYVDEWNVEANPNGNLTDLDTGKYLYSLYYESLNEIDFNLDTGFIVKGEDSASFLEEKLAILGLNEREAQEFIIYWLPKLEANNYNFIYFATMDEINENMPLSITPTPDSLIRVLMVFKGLDKPINIIPQQLTTPERTGFVAVEWGGTEIK